MDDEPKIISYLREQRGHDADVTEAALIKNEALLFALNPPEKRVQVLRELNAAVFDPRNERGERIDNGISLRERARLMGLERAYRNSHERLKGAGK